MLTEFILKTTSITDFLFVSTTLCHRELRKVGLIPVFLNLKKFFLQKSSWMNWPAFLSFLVFCFFFSSKVMPRPASNFVLLLSCPAAQPSCSHPHKDPNSRPDTEHSRLKQTVILVSVSFHAWCPIWQLYLLPHLLFCYSYAPWSLRVQLAHLASNPQLPRLGGKSLKGKLMSSPVPRTGSESAELNAILTSFSCSQQLPGPEPTIPVGVHVWEVLSHPLRMTQVCQLQTTT